ncbi:MAG TPA: ABC transporter permease [Anaerolineae bacterium]
MKILVIAYKDLLHSFRSLFAVGMMFGAPLFITGLIFLAFGGLSASTGHVTLPSLTVAIVNHDQPAANGQYLGKLYTDYLHNKQMPGWLKVIEMSDDAVARAAIERQEVGMAIILPANLSASVQTPAGSTIHLLQDPTLSLGPSIVKDLVQTVSDGISGARIAVTVSSEQAATRQVMLEAGALQNIGQQYSVWFTQLQQNLHQSDASMLDVQAPPAGSATVTGNSIARLITGIMAGMLVFFVFYSGAYSAQSILREDEEGTLARLFTTPTPRTQIMAGKFVAIFITTGVQSIVLLIVSALLFSIHWGAALGIISVTIGMAVVASGFGLVVMSFVRTMRQSGPILGGALSVTGMLGGLFTGAVPNMPAAFNTASLFMPQGWAMRGWKLVIDGASMTDVLLPVGVMLGIGILFFVVGALRFQKRFA